MARNRGTENFEKDYGTDINPKIDVFIKITELPMAVDPHGNKIVHRDHDEEDDGKK